MVQDRKASKECLSSFGRFRFRTLSPGQLWQEKRLSEDDTEIAREVFGRNQPWKNMKM